MHGCAKNNVFEEPPDRPVIDSINPAHGKAGTQIRLYGTGFSTDAGSNTVTINGVQLRVESATSKVVLATITSITGTGHVNISVNGNETQGPVFTYDQNAISINSISPGSGWIDTLVTIRGVGFGTKQDSATVNFNGHPAAIKKFSDTLIIVQAPSATNGAPGTVTVSVTVNGRTSNSLPFIYADQAGPVITVITPTSGWDYTTTAIIIKGSRFGTDQNSIVVKFDNVVASVQSAKDTQLVVAPPLHTAGYAIVTVTVNGKISNGVQYLYINPAVPVITSISPNSGWDYTTTSTIIRGSHFGVDQNAVVVKFDNLAASVQSVKDTQLIVAPPTHAAGIVTVTVTVNGNISNGVQYTYVQPTAPGTIEYSGTAQLSEARTQLAAAGTGNRIVFAGGNTNSGNNSTVADIYDVSTNTWTTAQLSQARAGLAAAATGNKIVFAGGDQGAGGFGAVYYKAVDIYDVSGNTWTTAQLSEARTHLAATAAGNKILFAGGDLTGVLTTFSKTVDIYDVSTNTWTTAQLSEARTNLVAAAAGNKIVFAGGANSSFSYSKTVDIYDVSTNQWTTAQLSEAKGYLAAAAAGDKIVFAGGSNGSGYSNTADIYDVSTNTWTKAQLSEGRSILAAAATGNKILFAGGYTGASSGNLSKTVDVYDVSTNTWTTMQLSEGRYFLAGAGAGNKIVFAGGNASFGNSKTVDIFTVH